MSKHVRRSAANCDTSALRLAKTSHRQGEDAHDDHQQGGVGAQSRLHAGEVRQQPEQRRPKHQPCGETKVLPSDLILHSAMLTYNTAAILRDEPASSAAHTAA
jgi:hypothetical protein